MAEGCAGCAEGRLRRGVVNGGVYFGFGWGNSDSDEFFGGDKL